MEWAERWPLAPRLSGGTGRRCRAPPAPAARCPDTPTSGCTRARSWRRLAAPSQPCARSSACRRGRPVRVKCTSALWRRTFNNQYGRRVRYFSISQVRWIYGVLRALGMWLSLLMWFRWQHMFIINFNYFAVDQSLHSFAALTFIMNLKAS